MVPNCAEHLVYFKHEPPLREEIMVIKKQLTSIKDFIKDLKLKTS